MRFLVKRSNGFKAESHFIGHELEWCGVPRDLHDFQQRLGTQLGPGVVGIDLSQQRGIRLAYGLRDLPCSKRAVKNKLVNIIAKPSK